MVAVRRSMFGVGRSAFSDPDFCPLATLRFAALEELRASHRYKVFCLSLRGED